MTTCTEIRLIKVSSISSVVISPANHMTQLVRIHPDEDVVACTWKEEVLPKKQTEYKYQLNPPGVGKKIHTLRAEKVLIDYYYGHAKCTTVD